MLENADFITGLSYILVVLWVVNQSGLFSVRLPRCTAWANSYLFMQHQVERVSLLIKRLVVGGWHRLVWCCRCTTGLQACWWNPAVESWHIFGCLHHMQPRQMASYKFTETKDAVWHQVAWTIKMFNFTNKDSKLLAAKVLWFNMFSYQMKVKKGLQLTCKPLSAFQIGKSKEAWRTTYRICLFSDVNILICPLVWLMFRWLKN